MRSVPDSVTNALVSGQTFRANARLTAYKSRVYFDSTVVNDNWDNKAPAWAHPAGATGYPMPEDMSYEAAIDKMVTVVLSPISGVYTIQLLIEGYATPIVPTYGGNPLTTTSTRHRPGIHGTSLWYHNGASWMKYTINLTTLAAHTAACLGTEVTFYTQVEGSIFPVSTTQAVVSYIDDGGTRIVFIDGSLGAHVCPSRIMIPNCLMSSAMDEDMFAMHYMSAVLIGDSIFLYATIYDGSVQGLQFSMTSNHLNGVWSTPFHAIPQDLSRFQIGNAMTYNGVIYLIGSFTRTQQFADATVHTLLCWSTDGRTFTMNKYTGVSEEQMRFLVDTDGTNLYFGSCNRTDREVAPYYIAGESAPNTVIIMIELSGDTVNGWQASIKAGSETYVDDPNVVEGNFSKLEIGIYTGSAFEYIHYHDCIISSITFSWQDGVRGANISLQTDPSYNTAVMTNPMYMQFQNRQYKFDPIADLGNMEKMGGTQLGSAWSLSYDFWDPTNTDGHTWEEQQGGSADIDDWTPDITTFADAFPIIEAGTKQFKIYGWSRAGCRSVTDSTLQESDTTGSGANNNTHKGLLLLEDLDGTRTIVVLDTLAEYSYSNFPQSYMKTRAGAYPIIYNLNGSTYAGWKVIKMGVRTSVGSASADDWNTFYLSRIEMPAVVVHPTRDNNTNEIGLDVIMDKTLITGWRVVENKPLLMDSTGVKTTSGLYTCKTGYVYAIVVQGDIEFTRGGKHYVQDMRFAAYQDTSDASYVTPTWSRSYPPGTGPYQFDGLQVTGKECPYRGTGTVAFVDNIPGGLLTDFVNHCYYMTHEESGFTPSSIDPAFVPYVYGGAALSYQFTLAGGGTTTIIRNNLQVFLFECPDPFTDFMFYGYDATDEQVPAPKQFKLGVPGSADIIPDYLNIWAYNTMKGTPQTLFSGTPYASWNFDAVARVQCVGPYTKVGCIGLATDQYNYLCAWIQGNTLGSNGTIGIGVVRDGLLTILGTSSVAVHVDKAYDIRFWHRDGKLGVEWKKTGAVWPTRGSQLTYTWTDADGPMAGKETDSVPALVMHMGIFSYIDPPVFRTTGFISSQNKIPLLPLDYRIEDSQSDFRNNDLFPIPGIGTIQVDIGGIIYQYTDKTNFVVAPAGPYQGRNITYWSGYGTDALDSPPYGFDNNWALESTHYEALSSKDNAGNGNGWAGGVVAINTGYAYRIHQTFFRPWVTTGGNKIYTRERIRIYSSEVMDENNALSDINNKVWITDALIGVTPVATLVEDYTHPEGSFVFLHNNDQSMCFGFIGISGDYDQSLSTLLDTFSKISGTGAAFPGDFIVGSATYGNGDEVQLLLGIQSGTPDESGCLYFDNSNQSGLLVLI